MEADTDKTGLCNNSCLKNLPGKKWEVWVCPDCRELFEEGHAGHSKNTKLGLWNKSEQEVSIKRVDDVTIRVTHNSVDIQQTCRKCGRRQTLSLDLFPVIVKDNRKVG